MKKLKLTQLISAINRTALQQQFKVKQGSPDFEKIEKIFYDTANSYIDSKQFKLAIEHDECIPSLVASIHEDFIRSVLDQMSDKSRATFYKIFGNDYEKLEFLEYVAYFICDPDDLSSTLFEELQLKILTKFLNHQIYNYSR